MKDNNYKSKRYLKTNGVKKSEPEAGVEQNNGVVLLNRETQAGPGKDDDVEPKSED